MSTLRVAELDFDTIKSNLKSFLSNKPEFTDYNFEGSGLSVLLDVLAYNTHYNAVTANMLLQEMYLDTATKRSSVGIISKRLGYTPRSKKAATAIVNIEAFPQDFPSSMVLSKNAQFNALLTFNTTATFVTRDSVAITPTIDQRYIFQNVKIYEGNNDIYRYVYASNTNQRFEIPNKNVDISTLRVIIQESTTNTSASEWKSSDSIYDIDENSEVYFLRYNENNQYEVYFGDNNIGKSPVDGNLIILDYISTNGSVANNIKKFTFAGEFINTSRIITTTVSESIGGAEEESIDEIKVNAQNSVYTQNRAVSKSDYETLISQIIPVDDVVVYGGETLSPPVYGKVFICIKQLNTTNNLTFSQKSYIDSILLKKSVVSVMHEFVDPTYTYVKPSVKIVYDSKFMSESESTLLTQINTTINDYSNASLNKFESVLELSKLSNKIQNINSSFIANEITVELKKQIPYNIGFNTKYTINFNTELNKSNIQASVLSVYSDLFRLVEYPTIYCKLVDDNGIMKVITYNSNNIETVIDNCGYIDYMTGIVVFTLNMHSVTNSPLHIYADPKSSLISTSNNDILTISPSDIKISLLSR